MLAPFKLYLFAGLFLLPLSSSADSYEPSLPIVQLGSRSTCPWIIRFLGKRMERKTLQVVSGDGESQEKAYARLEALARIWTVCERYRNRVYTIEKDGEKLEFKVGPRIGRGIFGVVHEAHLLTPYSQRRQEIFPQFYFGKDPITSFAIKFPAFISSVNMVERITSHEIRNEGELERDIQELLPPTEIVLPALKTLWYEPGLPNAWFYTHGRAPFLIKERAPARYLNWKTIRDSGVPLDPVQMGALRRDIFRNAQGSKILYGIALDIRFSNLWWDPRDKRWGVYERNTLPGGVDLNIGLGWENYLYRAQSEILRVREALPAQEVPPAVWAQDSAH